MIRKIFSLATSSEDIKEVERLAEQLQLEIVGEEVPDELTFRFDDEGLALVKEGMALRGDYSKTKMLKRLKTANLRGELLVRAAKVKKLKSELKVIDATAGLGEDALLLAASGFSVDLYEYNPIIAALLRDTLRRAEKIPELQESVSRMSLKEKDSITEMPRQENQGAVILLDPMFPARHKSGLVKKKFQIIQNLEQPCSDEDALMHAAMAAHPYKIIVKRPLKGPYLAGVKPNYSISGKGIRYDCITVL